MAPPVVVSNREEDLLNTEPSMSGKPIVGIIYPPPEIRNIVDKTASFVARNGIEFENRIKANEASNPKFNFLGPTDPYNAYYQHKIKDFQEGTAVEPSIPKPVVPLKIQEAVKAAEFVPTEPPPEYEFVADPATINAFELDLIKLAALFVARNGRQFLTQLMNREMRNYQFDFLKPQHSNFSYFTKLVEQYTKVLIPPKNIVQRLREELDQPKKVLESVKYRVEWQRHQRRIREREEAEAEKERMAYAQIDWHDFVVVQTVDFQPNESMNLPPPCTPKDVGARILAQARIEATKAATQTVEMEMESDSEEEQDNEPEPVSKVPDTAVDVEQPKIRSVHEVTQPMPAAPLPETVVVRKDYDPRVKQVEKVKTAEKFVISPLTGERIPADKLSDHMRFNTVDSQYFVQREMELQNKEAEPVFAQGVDISSNIQAFAERRTDIFGVGARGAEQTVIGKKLGEEEMPPPPDPKNIWDGHSATIDATTKAAQQAITIEQQIAEIHKAQGLLPEQTKDKQQPTKPASPPPRPPPVSVPSQVPRPRPPPVVMQRVATVVPVVPVVMQQQPRFITHRPMMPQRMHGMPIMPQHGIVQAGDDEPAHKRARTEEQLIPEEEFMKTHQGPINVRVFVPSAPDRPEWKLEGQALNLMMEMTEPVQNIKQKIQEATGMPASKQKLSFDGMFIKDSQSLAFYNMSNGATVQLQQKERGGRKK